MHSIEQARVRDREKTDGANVVLRGPKLCRFCREAIPAGQYAVIERKPLRFAHAVCHLVYCGE